MILLMSEWWAYDILMIFISPLGEKNIAAQTLIINIIILIDYGSLGLIDTLQTLIGNTMGANDSLTAQKIAK